MNSEKHVYFLVNPKQWVLGKVDRPRSFARTESELVPDGSNEIMRITHDYALSLPITFHYLVEEEEGNR